MIAITQLEKQAISKKFPNAFFVRTMKGDSKRKHYFCTEERHIVNYLRSLRNPEEVKVKSKR